MIRADVRAYLEAAGVPADSFSLDGELRDETYVLDQVGREWVVFYSERGLHQAEARFATEEAALEHLLVRIRKDFRL